MGGLPEAEGEAEREAEAKAEAERRTYLARQTERGVYRRARKSSDA
jgi:hypothetical protein